MWGLHRDCTKILHGKFCRVLEKLPFAKRLFAESSPWFRGLEPRVWDVFPQRDLKP